MSTQTQLQTQSETAEPIAITPPREGTKQARLVSLLSRKSGVTLAKASERLSWLTHTTSAAMTGLRKRGYVIERIQRPKKDSVYMIARTEADI